VLDIHCSIMYWGTLCQVVEIDASNYDETINTSPFVMINFYAPW
jgi:hypothetical protein